MRWLLTIACVLASLTPARAEDRLPVRVIDVPFATVPDHGPWSFDLIDYRAEERLAAAPRHVDADPHTFFNVKHHLGAAAGYDNGILHGSIGYYLTVAEWGRWNFGVPSLEIGVGRYPTIDRLSQRPVKKDSVTLLVSLASAHYRVGYLRAWGLHGYLNVEQVFDLHENRAGSQFGFSLSTK
ncbi:MAG: hypothetical protein JWL71_249 [Acidobacteria bacterium]|nr:hypothetical protein [Acidobacteriota bacterium]